jgi:hypothetical protein
MIENFKPLFPVRRVELGMTSEIWKSGLDLRIFRDRHPNLKLQYICTCIQLLARVLHPK